MQRTNAPFLLALAMTSRVDRRPGMDRPQTVLLAHLGRTLFVGG